MTTTWMVRAGRGSRFYELFRERGFASMGWARIGAVTELGDRAKVIEAAQKAYPEMSAQAALVAGSQLYRFARDIKVGDRVVTYDSSSRNYSCGQIAGEYEYHPGQDDDELINRRKVDWLREKPRDDLSIAAKNLLGSTLTLFRVEQSVSDELWNIASSDKTVPAPAVADPKLLSDGAGPLLEAASFEQVSTTAKEKIKDKIATLDGYQLQDLVAGLLRAMGYQTTVAPKGVSDRSSDIRATPDGFGFKEPRIVVEVKHRNARMGAPDIRTFMGGRKAHEKCMFVSTGGFAKEAYYEAERSSIPLTLVDLDQLVGAILLHYPSFDEETRRLLSLGSVYWLL